ncbi:MAG: aminotransferase class V-fold PLP-dependent enzyme [Acidobacteria bacterium]|nr:aminotransferase class V-fold PLP-dependent enzyme [Acidobacteriota bacterium]MBV9070096.1 aminotransferase class V-fold PLP-dependent enzyme [Acidobacteriota bacterium]MBV9185461.1 aminotransferase class V-fold PLP-dependent enzyme [Acidobacteriota bacterium]
MLSVAPVDTRTFFDELRDREFSRLDAQHHAYLDYAGSALYGDSQLRAHHEILRDGIFGNPHSDSSPSRASTEVMDSARRRLLRFLDVDESTHDVIFTANTTAAIKLVAEAYPFSKERGCFLATDNHNSMNGIREYARRAGAPIHYLPLDPDLRLLDAELLLAEASLHGEGLVAFPAQSNFSGVQHPLDLVTKAHALGFDVLLDVAAFIPGHALSLRRCPADFAALSFYKLFGYPTGLGALVARRDALSRLRRPWFAGGTVMYASVAADAHLLRPRHEGFEDGTPDFLAIAALDAGFDLLDEVGMPRLTAHVSELARDFVCDLRALRHTNGAPIVRIYGPRDRSECGGAVAFNICGRNGTPIPYTLVETRARRANVSLRGGCFCNPGASEAAFALDPSRIADCLAKLNTEFTPERFAECTNTAVGAIRASIGLANNAEDIHRAADVVASFAD